MRAGPLKLGMLFGQQRALPQQGPIVVFTEGLTNSCAGWVYAGTNVGFARLGNTPNDCPCDIMIATGATTPYE